MISRRQLVMMGIVYTAVVAAAISVMTDPPAVLVFGVAVAWFSIGKAWDRLPKAEAPPMKWGRQ